MQIEDEYMDVLRNIEFAVKTGFGIYPDITDYAIQRVYEALIECYSAEVLNRPPKPHKLDEKEQIMFTEIKKFCEWHMGRNDDLFTSDNGAIPPPTARTPSEIVACLKRLARSVEKWTRRHGRQGYLKFISEFIA